MLNIETKPSIGLDRVATAVNEARLEADRELVERARSGDQEAFSELVRTHRAQAYGWANTIARDDYLAEDIVQDALIRAFLHLGTLTDVSRFLPWLHTIVRNQAYMKLRRGGPFAKEQPFAGFNAKSSYSDAGYCGDSDSTDWGDIDRILYRMSRSAAEEAQQGSDPAKGILRKELMEQLSSLLNCLSRHERQIFEAHFFRELSPEEIAQLFDTTRANVYNLLSRSRAKVQRERIRVTIRLYVRQRAELGQKRINILQSPQI
ncbi:RNA polymerase sigma factor [Paenibacillus senegalensis]|uniref:RNA polymerase sigma factor n=1 Tax=Paenibacillus senegalensis TaxID=1465766 RepID=UPI00031B4A5E|nr:RNA polymerase sigma factor [Paenibacillus senegalensis]